MIDAKLHKYRLVRISMDLSDYKRYKIDGFEEVDKGDIRNIARLALASVLQTMADYVRKSETYLLGFPATMIVSSEESGCHFRWYVELETEAYQDDSEIQKIPSNHAQSV